MFFLSQYNQIEMILIYYIGFFESLLMKCTVFFLNFLFSAVATYPVS